MGALLFHKRWSEKGTFKQGTEESEKVEHSRCGAGTCKGPEAGIWPTCLENRRKPVWPEQSGLGEECWEVRSEKRATRSDRASQGL